MKNEQLHKILAGIGLSKQESAVYLATLVLGPTTVLKIARVAEIKRTTVYLIIESLKQKGLLSIEPHGFKKLYVAEDPATLERLLELRHKELRTHLPELQALYNMKGQESVVKYYEGLSAIKGVYDSLLQDIKSHEQYLAISNAEEWVGLDKKWFISFMERRAKLSIDVRLLLQTSESAEFYIKCQKNYSFEVRTLPEGTAISTSLTITPQRMVTHQLTPPVCAVVVENRSMIQSQTELFELLWQGAK